MGNKLFVGNLDYQTSSEDLSALFAEAGLVRRAQVVMDRETQRSKGFAFVEMADDTEALRAISLCNGRVLNGRAIVVNEARPREDRPSGSNPYRGSNSASRPKFREVKHKARGGRKARSF